MTVFDCPFSNAPVSHLPFSNAVAECARGRIVKTTGDGLLLEFASVVDAVRCAVEVQREMAERNADVPPDRRIEFRMGINVGDIIKDGRDIHGDGVNLAARLEALAEPGGICVSRMVRDQVRDKLDFSFEDMGEQQVKNIARPVRVYRVRDVGAATKRLPPVLPLPDKPSIAVLPFQNMSGDPEQEYFADGIVEEITAALCRVRDFFVIARNSAFSYKGRAVPVQQVSRELGVRYLIEGSVRKAGNRVRITAQLIDASSGNHLWADKYDGAVMDIFDLQDRITASVVGAIQPSVRAAEIERSRRKRPESLDAYDLVLRAYPNVWSLERAANAEALALLNQATTIEPYYPLALSLAAWCHAQQVVYNWAAEPACARTEALRLAQMAAAASGEDPTTLTVLAAAYSIVRSHGIGAAHFVAGRYADTALWIERGLIDRPGATWAYRELIAAYALLGREADARAGLSRLLNEYPDLTVSRVLSALVYSQPTLDRIAEGLRKAGMTE